MATIYELSIGEQKALWELVGEVRDRLLTGLKPDGFNIGFNDGLAAGQTVPHAHIHVIPRRTWRRPRSAWRNPLGHRKQCTILEEIADAPDFRRADPIPGEPPTPAR